MPNVIVYLVWSCFLSFAIGVCLSHPSFPLYSGEIISLIIIVPSLVIWKMRVENPTKNEQSKVGRRYFIFFGLLLFWAGLGIGFQNASEATYLILVPLGLTIFSWYTGRQPEPSISTKGIAVKYPSTRRPR